MCFYWFFSLWLPRVEINNLAKLICCNYTEVHYVGAYTSRPKERITLKSSSVGRYELKQTTSEGMVLIDKQKRSHSNSI